MHLKQRFSYPGKAHREFFYRAAFGEIIAILENEVVIFTSAGDKLDLPLNFSTVDDITKPVVVYDPYRSSPAALQFC